MDRSAVDLDRSDRDGLLMQIAELVSDVRTLSDQIRELQTSRDSQRRELERYQKRVRELELEQSESLRLSRSRSSLKDSREHKKSFEDLLRQQL